MKPDIAQKLSPILRGPLTNEMQVVYVLAEVRKLLELERLQRKYPSVNFHCCWALHSKAKGGGADRILRRFDDAYDHLKDMKSAPEEVRRAVQRTMALESMREELRLFLSDMALPPATVDDPTCWFKFMYLFFAVVQECPFTLSAKTYHSTSCSCGDPKRDESKPFVLRHLKEIVVITSFPIRQSETEMSVYVQWKLIGKKEGDQLSIASFFTERHNSSEVEEGVELEVNRGL